MALYGYKFALPTGLSNDQKKKLINLANKTASNASVKDTGKFRGGWRSSIIGDTLTVSNDVVYSYFVEMGKGYNAHNKYKVRNALLRIGFEDMFQGTVGTLAIAAGVAVATTGSTAAAGTGTESSQEGASSQNTAQSTAPTTLFTNEELLALTTPKMLQDALQSKISVAFPQMNTTSSITTTQGLTAQANAITMQEVGDTNSLLLLIAAAIAANEVIGEEDEEVGTAQE